MNRKNLERELRTLTFAFIWQGDVLNAVCKTDGTEAVVYEIVDEVGEVPDSLDWAMIECAKVLAVCLWMDERATFYLNGDIH